MQEESVVPAATNHPFATPAGSSLLPSTQKGQKGAGHGARSWSVARGQEAAAWVEETVGFYVTATGKDETQIRQRLAEMKPEKVRRSREHWRLRAEEKQCFQEKEEESWELFRRLPGHKQTTKEKFSLRKSSSIERRALWMVPAARREKYLLEWTSELRKRSSGGGTEAGGKGDEEVGARRLLCQMGASNTVPTATLRSSQLICVDVMTLAKKVSSVETVVYLRLDGELNVDVTDFQANLVFYLCIHLVG